MPKLREAVEDFLAQKRIAVAGVSRDPKQPANLVYRTMRKAGYDVFAVNPNAVEVEGDTCYRDLSSIPGGVDAVVIATPPAVSKQVVADCAALGISRVWLHRSFGADSVSDEAVAPGREHGMTTIAGGCPMMFVPGADVGHRCMRLILNVTGGLPKQV